MPFGQCTPQPQEPLQKTKAFSLETTSDTVSLISESTFSVGSTVTLENLPPPLGWSREGSNAGLLLAPSRAGVSDISPGYSPSTEYGVTDLGDYEQHARHGWDNTR